MPNYTMPFGHTILGINYARVTDVRKYTEQLFLGTSWSHFYGTTRWTSSSLQTQQRFMEG